MTASRVAVLEHEELSPQFIAILRASDDLGHDDCPICDPPIERCGIENRTHMKALTCPLCGVQIKNAAVVLIRRDYERVRALHVPTYETASDEVWGRDAICAADENAWPCNTIRALDGSGGAAGGAQDGTGGARTVTGDSQGRSGERGRQNGSKTFGWDNEIGDQA